MNACYSYSLGVWCVPDCSIGVFAIHKPRPCTRSCQPAAPVHVAVGFATWFGSRVGVCASNHCERCVAVHSHVLMAVTVLEQTALAAASLQRKPFAGM